MISFKSLSLIGKEVFEADVYCDEQKIYSVGETITESIILKLFFRKPYYKEQPKPQLPNVKNIDFEDANFDFDDFIEKIINVQKCQGGLVFDRDEAEKFSEMCSEIGKTLGYDESTIQELKISSFFYKIGCITLTESDKMNPDFDEKMSASSTNILMDMNGSSSAVEGVMNFAKPYSFEITFEKPGQIPFSHIIAVCYYWTKLLAKHKDRVKCLDILRKNGAAKYNFYVLHKLINYLRV